MANIVRRDVQIKEMIQNLVVVGQSQISMVFWGAPKNNSCQKRLRYLVLAKYIDRVEITDLEERFIYFSSYMPEDYWFYLLRNELLIAFGENVETWTKSTIKLKNGKTLFVSPVIDETDVLSLEIIDSPQIIIFKNEHLLSKLADRFPFEKHSNILLTCPELIRKIKNPLNSLGVFIEGQFRLLK